jgi:hypothetical protein
VILDLRRASRSRRRARPIRFSHDPLSGVGHTDSDPRRTRATRRQRDCDVARHGSRAGGRGQFEERTSLAGLRRRRASRSFEFVKEQPAGDGQRPAVQRAAQRGRKADARAKSASSTSARMAATSATVAAGATRSGESNVRRTVPQPTKPLPTHVDGQAPAMAPATPPVAAAAASRPRRRPPRDPRGGAGRNAAHRCDSQSSAAGVSRSIEATAIKDGETEQHRARTRSTAPESTQGRGRPCAG